MEINPAGPPLRINIPTHSPRLFPLPYFGNDKTPENIFKAIDFRIKFEHVRNPAVFTEDMFKDVMMFRGSILVSDKCGRRMWVKNEL